MSGNAQGIHFPDSAGAMSLPPARPLGVPPDAVWVDSDGEWQLKQTDERGQLQGPFRSWRADGSARTVATYKDGNTVGAAWTFHPDGSLFSLGCYREGAARGVHHRYANDDPRAERLQSCCVPPGAWQLRQDYSRVNSIDRGWFDRSGQRLLESGEPYPDRPANVPPEAWYNEALAVWEAGVVYEETGFSGTRRRWSTGGVLTLVEDLRRGQRHGELQCFDDQGALVSVGHYLDGELSGPFWAARLIPGQLANPRAHSQRGFFRADQAHGVWRAFDVEGEVVEERDLGLTADTDTLARSPALLNERAPAETWQETASRLFSGGRVGEGFVAAARAAARLNDATHLVVALAHRTLPLGREAAQSEAAQALERANSEPTKAPAILVDALKRGADAAPILWALAKVLPDRDLVALDLVSAALLLSPEFTEPLSTRTLLHAALGDLDSARADVSRLASSSPEQAEFLDLYLRIYFPRFTYWPGTEPLAGDAEGVSLSMVRTAGELRAVIGTYATRLMCLRQALKSHLSAGGLPDGDDGAFMIPDLSRLLPDGPRILTRSAFQMSAEEYGGLEEDAGGAGADDEASHAGAASPSHVEITIDEINGVEPLPSSLLRILRQARVDWSGLVWLCWAAGLESPGLPDEIRPPPTFARAAVLTMERVWRCRDKLKTSGLLALTKGVPGFDWEGTAIDLVPAALADVALDEYIEARAVFSWLCDPANRSPWQDDLRLSED